MAYTTINNSKLYQNTMLYTGDDGTRNITESGTFQADLVWLKRRNSAASHHLVDAVRGATKAIYSNATGAEATDSTGVTGFVTDGFSLGGQGGYNNNGDTFVSWTWKANGQGSSNTDGSINTTYTSVNTTAGFSICKWTGSGANATIGHGLGAVPKMIIVKNTSTTDSWMVYHVGSGSNAYLHLETTNAALSPSTAQFQATTPTSSFFYVGTADGTNKSSSNMIAYCFAEKQGYSKMGIYTGNGSTTNNAFIYTGFKPSWFMCKRTDGAGSWAMFDNKRETFNDGNNSSFFADSNDAENVNDYNVEFFSNGIKTNASSDNIGRSGGTYLYMAFAEAPLVGTNNTPCTAR
tara:strand:+ start:509 stop:1555 length:1047 start_codon:yes stop_codon:yes gene_type:complete